MAEVISCLHATRGRPGAPWQCRELWAKRADPHGPSFNWVFSMDADDPVVDIFQERWTTLSEGPPTYLLVGGPPFEANPAWNRAAGHHAAKAAQVLLTISDDFEPPQNWNTLVVDRFVAHGGLDKPLVLGVASPHGGPYLGDGLQTMCVMTQACKEKWGYVFYPEYPGMWADNDFTCKAILDGVFRESWDLVFNHWWHGAENDPLHDHVHARHMRPEVWSRGAALMDERVLLGFPDARAEGVWGPPHSGFQMARDDGQEREYFLFSASRRCNRQLIETERWARGCVWAAVAPAFGSLAWHWTKSSNTNELLEAAEHHLSMSGHHRSLGGRFRDWAGWLIYKNACAWAGVQPRPEWVI